MADPELTTILVLGPMQPGLDASGRVIEDPRTAQMTRLVSSIADDLVRTEPALGPVFVDQPDTNNSASIIPGILTKVEAADLVILDLSGGSQNVMYELGLVHALGLPYILTTADSGPPFYMLNIFCIGNFERLEPFDRQYNPHSQLLSRIREYLRSLRDTSGGDPDTFATNPVTDYFQGLPVVDISAPAGLAAGYWRNAVRRFVRLGGYLDPPDRTVTFPAPVGDKTMQIRHFVSVEPISILAETPEEDFRRLGRTLADHGYRTTKGAINQAILPDGRPSELDMRSFSVDFLSRVQSDDAVAIVEPGIVIDIPTTLYALQFSPRVLRIDDGPAGRPQAAAVLDRLRRRRYGNMLDRFYRIMHHFLRRDDAKGHQHQVHFVRHDELAALLETLVEGA